MRKIITLSLTALCAVLAIATTQAAEKEPIRSAAAAAIEASLDEHEEAPVAPIAESAPTTPSKVTIGALMQSYFQVEQSGFGATLDDIADIDDPSLVLYGFNLYRARLLLGASITPRDYLYIDTELSASLGMDEEKSASIKILDAYYTHRFSDTFSLTAGKMIASYSRNRLQSEQSLMGNDYGFTQHSAEAYGDDDSRDIGINAEGSFKAGKLSYRVGLFSGCRDYSLYTDEESAPLRIVGRLQYNIFGKGEYVGSLLGKGRMFAIGVGADNQGGYHSVGADIFADAPLGNTGSLTLNAAYSYACGGDVEHRKYHFASTVAQQNIVFAEAGYYFKGLKLQPWVRYELRDRLISTLADENVYGGGVNYYFNGYGSNLKLSYMSRRNTLVGNYYGQMWLQLQFYLF